MNNLYLLKSAWKSFRKFVVIFSLLSGVLALNACDQGGTVAGKVEAARKRNDGPAIWKITDQDSTLYLYGSVHLLPDDMKWQRRDMLAAFDEVGTVFFEVPDDNKSKLDATILQQQYGVYESGDRLSNHLDVLAQKRLTAAAYNVKIPPAKLEIFKPWLAADILSIAIAQDNGLLASNSVDSVLRTKAEAAGKSIRALEDMRSYIEVVALLPEWVQIHSLEETIKKFDELPADIKKVNAAWLVGNLPYLEKNMLDPARTKSPEMFAALFTDRNLKWAKTLDAFMQGDDNAMVVVGVGHLIGAEGLPFLLRELGYDVERLRRFDLPNF
ncbi:MAG: hypothetical protein COA43_04945 [Robiginitomaculum sp.]|nr:MAG: hypothetical protein COA43_04945 [Robiginitomaculum sp.]